MSTTPVIEQLSRLYLFKLIEPGDLQRLVDACQVLNFSADELIFQHGEPSDSALLVVSGRLAVSLPDGERERPLGDVRPGEVAGETALLEVGGRRGATLRAQEASTCLELTPEVMLTAADNPALVALEQHLLGTMVRRIREINTNIKRATQPTPAAASTAAGGDGGGGLLARLRSFFRGA